MLMMASQPLYTAAVLEFFGGRLRRRWVLGPVAFVFVTWLVLRDDYVGRVSLAGELFGVGELCPAVALYRRGRATRSPAQWLVMSAFGLYALVFFWRFAVVTLAPGSLRRPPEQHRPPERHLRGDQRLQPPHLRGLHPHAARARRAGERA